MKRAVVALIVSCFLPTLVAQVRASLASEPRDRPAFAPKALRRGLAVAFGGGGSAPSQRRARARVGESEGRSPSDKAMLGWPAVEQVFHQQVKAAGIVGSSVLLVREGSIAATATDGYQELATRRAVDADTIFHWASITKTFTGIAIMQLRDRGRLKLDDPVVKYVPEFQRVHNPTATYRRSPSDT